MLYYKKREVVLMQIYKNMQNKVTLSALADYCKRKGIICEIENGGETLIMSKKEG
jgi:hypothetical protein